MKGIDRSRVGARGRGMMRGIFSVRVVGVVSRQAGLMASGAALSQIEQQGAPARAPARLREQVHLVRGRLRGRLGLLRLMLRGLGLEAYA